MGRKLTHHGASVRSTRQVQQSGSGLTSREHITHHIKWNKSRNENPALAHTRMLSVPNGRGRRTAINLTRPVHGPIVPLNNTKKAIMDTQFGHLIVLAALLFRVSFIFQEFFDYASSLVDGRWYFAYTNPDNVNRYALSTIERVCVSFSIFFSLISEVERRWAQFVLKGRRHHKRPSRLLGLMTASLAIHTPMT